MGLAALHQCAQIRYRYASRDVSINMLHHLSYLPCQQSLLSVVRTLLRVLRSHLFAQQRSCFKYRAVRNRFVMNLANGCIEQRNHIPHPFARWVRAKMKTGLGVRQSIDNQLRSRRAAVEFGRGEDGIHGLTLLRHHCAGASWSQLRPERSPISSRALAILT